LNKKRSIRYLLAAAVAAAVSIPLISQVKSAQTAQHQAAQQAADAQQGAQLQLPPPAPPAKPVDPGKVIATAGDLAVTAGEYNTVTASLGPQYAQALTQPNVKKQIVERIFRVKELAREAERRKLEDSPEVKSQLQIQRDEILANALAKQMQADTNDAADRAYFDAHKSNFDDVKARHILIRTPDSPVPVPPGAKELTEEQAKAKADDISRKLKNGGDFAAEAKAESDDKGTGAKGGDLGTFAPWKMDPTFAKATLDLKPNQISEPVKTQFGYHIIQLLDDKPRTYEQAKSEVGQARWSEMLSDLGKKDKIQYEPSFFGSGSAEPTTRPAGAAMQSTPGATAQAHKAG